MLAAIPSRARTTASRWHACGPKGQGLFEVLYWNPYHDRWRPVGSFGTVLALDQALEFIADDPLDCFWR